MPFFLKRLIQTNYVKFRFHVKTSRGSHLHKTIFEPYCLVGKGSGVFSSTIGRSSYIANYSSIRRAKIGRYCAIGDYVRICLGSHPTKKFVGLHPCFYSLNGQGTPSYSKKEKFDGHKFIDSEKKYVVKIGNDVWVGSNASIMDGVTIGDGAVIGMGAIVTKNVEPYSVVVGIPARHKRFRFSKDQREFLLKFRWWEKPEAWIKDNAKYFDDIERFMEKYLKNEV